MSGSRKEEKKSDEKIKVKAARFFQNVKKTMSDCFVSEEDLLDKRIEEAERKAKLESIMAKHEAKIR